MKLTSKVLFFCGTLLIQVYASSLESRDASEIIDDVDDNRGLLDLVLGGRPVVNQNQPVFVPPPPAPGQAPVPVIPVAPVQNQVQRPGILSNLGNHFDNLLGGKNEELLFDGLNIDWIRSALSKCAKVDPRQLTAIVPTTTNQLREPKIYYFENSTTNEKTWSDAQSWCSKNGMQLVTVDDVNENRVLQEEIRQILSGSAIGGGTSAFWTGLNKRLQADTTWTYVGDSSSTFIDWHPNEPTPATALCGAYVQRVSAENIHFAARQCANAARYICEVSPECISLFMSRYKTHYHIQLQQQDLGLTHTHPLDIIG